MKWFDTQFFGRLCRLFDETTAQSCRFRALVAERVFEGEWESGTIIIVITPSLLTEPRGCNILRPSAKVGGWEIF